MTHDSTSNNSFPVPADFSKQANLSLNQYNQWYQQSIDTPEPFWKDRALENIDWIKPFTQVYQGDFSQGEVQWFVGGYLNLCANCIDRHLPTRADQTAITWEPNDPNEKARHISYQQLHTEVCKLANGLEQLGIQAGDRVCIYLPMIPEAAYAMLACARIGAIHSVVFGGFSPQSLKDRIIDSGCKLVITADEGLRGNKTIALKANADAAVEQCPEVKNMLIVKRTGASIAWQDKRDVWYHELVQTVSSTHEAPALASETPLFILYTSGSTGKPKGVLHTSAGYLLGSMLTFKYILDYREGDIYWCTADVGWITGHSYIIYGPLANGATTLMFEGIPNYPSAARCWEIIDKHQVNIFYTAPTAIRALMALGDEPVLSTNRGSLRLLGTVGEPINPQAWLWYHQVVGNGNCPIVDTWWQTETGAMMIAPIPGAFDLKPGSATKPFFGVQPVLLDDSGEELAGEGCGKLAFKTSWPSQIRTVFGDHQRCVETYYSQFPGYYFSGDGARRDADGDYWITGRVDDVLNVSGHRLGTAEIESALVQHECIAEAAVVGYPHPIKGQGIYAYIIPMQGSEINKNTQEGILQTVSEMIGSIAKPDKLHITQGLPKTRSGKIMRRILRKIAQGETSDLGDTSTLADPSVIEPLIAGQC